MPTIQLPLISYEELISEPIRAQILTLIGGKVNYVNSAGNKLTRNGEIDLANDEESKVNISETDWSDSLLSSNLTAHNVRYSVIEDREIGLYLKLADIDREFTINISKRFVNRGDAIWWRNSIIGSFRDGMSNVSNDIAISPCISNKVLGVMDECLKRKNKRLGQEQMLRDYLLETAFDSITIDKNSDGTDIAIMFPEKLSNLVFSLPTVPPEPQLDNGEYLLEMEITTIIRVPVSSVLGYPSFVGGLIMPNEMLEKDIDVNMSEEYMSQGNVVEDLLSFNGGGPSHYRTYGYQLPSFEGYFFSLSKMNLSVIFQVRVAPSMDDPRVVCNLNDFFNGPIQGYQLDPEILPYLVEHRDLITNHHHSGITVLLMKGGDMITQSKLFVDEHLRLCTTYDMDMLGDYHLCFVTHSQTASVTENVFNTFIGHQTLFNRLIRHTNPELNPSVLPDNEIVTIPIYRKIFDLILDMKHVTGPVTANSLVLNSRLAN